MPEHPLLREAGLLIAFVQLSGPRGRRFVRVAVDTGATLSMIPPKAALAVGINPARSLHFRETLTASGRELIPLIKVPEVRLFEKTVRRPLLACHALPPESPVQGLLGLDLLTRIKAVIDLDRNRIQIP